MSSRRPDRKSNRSRRPLGFFSADPKLITDRTLQLEPLEERKVMAASVTTDQFDYAPWQTATILGSGFAVGEGIQVQVLHSDGRPNDGPQHAPWIVTDGDQSSAYVDLSGITHRPDLDGVLNGSIQTAWAMDEDAANSTFRVDTLGLQSGEAAQTTFTDSTILSTNTGGNWNAASSWQAIARSGNITSSTSSTIVTGVNTLFTSELAVGSIIAGVGTVASIQGNTQLTLTANASAANSGAAYNAQVVPGANDDVTVSSGATITLNVSTVQVNSMTVVGTLALNNNSATVGALSGAGNITLGSGTLTAGSSGASTYSGAISGTGSFVKIGSAALTMQGSSSYSGTTTINAGTLQLSGASGALTGTSGITISGASLILDNLSANGGNNNNRLNDSASLTFNGGTFIYNGANAANSSQVTVMLYGEDGKLIGIGNGYGAASPLAPNALTSFDVRCEMLAEGRVASYDYMVQSEN